MPVNREKVMNMMQNREKVMQGCEVEEVTPRRPWFVARYGISLAQVKDANGRIVLDQLNFATAEFIVEKVNA